MATLSVYRGDSKTYNLTFTDGGTALDITGYTIFFTVKVIVDDSADDTNAVISKTVTSHTDPTNGITEIVLSPTDTDIDVGTYDYDMQYKTDTGDIVTFEKGNYKILADVTRRTS